MLSGIPSNISCSSILETPQLNSKEYTMWSIPTSADNLTNKIKDSLYQNLILNLMSLADLIVSKEFARKDLTSMLQDKAGWCLPWDKYRIFNLVKRMNMSYWWWKYVLAGPFQCWHLSKLLAINTTYLMDLTLFTTNKLKRISRYSGTVLEYAKKCRPCHIIWFNSASIMLMNKNSK